MALALRSSSDTPMASPAPTRALRAVPARPVRAARPVTPAAPVNPAAPVGATPHRPARECAAVYRRRRVAALAVLVGVVVLALVAPLLSAGAGADDGLPPAGAPAVYVVKPGDSLWSIAQELAPRRDPRPVVSALRRAAGTDDLQPGQHILVPPGLAR